MSVDLGICPSGAIWEETQITTRFHVISKHLKGWFKEAFPLVCKSALFNQEEKSISASIHKARGPQTYLGPMCTRVQPPKDAKI